MDVFSKEKRSKVMAAIRSRDTVPERILRTELYSRGFRYRLYDKSLAGKPDIVFRKLRAVIQVRGCFWHGHTTCIDGHIPKTRADYWQPKITGNKQRDRKNDAILRRDGWCVIEVWECELASCKRREIEVSRIVRLLSARASKK
jgi:DNA mismatch endonuclease, patch repair protein